MAKALTTKAVEAMKADPEKRLEIPDPALSGLYLVVQPSGAKSWALRYRLNRKPKKLTLGRWPLMGIAAARTAASEAIEAVEHGTDPNAQKQKEKADAKILNLDERDKIRPLVDLYEKRHLSTLKSGKVVYRELERHCVDLWGERTIHEIQRRDIVDLLDTIKDSGREVTANRLRAYLSAFFNWAVEREIINVNPAAGIKRVAKEVSRDRVLSDDEIRWFWKACEREGQPWGQMGQLLLLTGQRLGEVCGICDDELNGTLWQLPSGRTKNKRAHIVPLSPQAIEILDGMTRIKSPIGLFFTTTGASPVSGFHKARAHLAEQMAEVAQEETGEIVEIPHWTFHDLRRTAATGMARLRVPVRVTESILNHVSGTGSGIVAVYQRHDMADEKREALESWGRFVERLYGNSQDEVEIVQFQRSQKNN